MIFLNWFNRLKNRLFSEENESLDKQSEQYDELNEPEDETGQLESNEKPIFRFPIITDSEIYGWEEDGSSPEREYTETVTDLEEDDFEPIPFYQNDRWSKNDIPTKIYRSNTTFDNMEQVDRKKDSSVRKDERSIESIEPVKPIEKLAIKKFNPTKVPSPIFGFSNREKLADLSNRAESTMLPKPKAIIEKEKKSAVKEPDDIPMVNKTYIDSIESSKLENLELSYEKVSEEINEVVEPEEIIEPELDAVEVLEPELELELEAVKVLEPELEAEEVEVEILEPEPEEVVLVERLDEKEMKKEKVVPFNVLMLKTDKEKLKKTVKLSEIKEDKKKPQNLKQNDEQELMVEETDEEQHYVLPSLEYLIPPELHVEDTEWLKSQSEKLEESLSHFGIQATVIDAVQGPTVTRFELTVGQGTKVSRVRNLTDDLKLTLAAKEIRIQAPIPGESSIGIEIPNRTTRPVRISEVIGTNEFMSSDSPLEAVLGLGLTGEPVTLDLRKMPHGLIAGATGSGKSVCINSILVSLLYKASPSDLKMMLIDPKMVELAPFNGIPHLISPVITDVKAATAALKWAVGEMERRYELLAHTGVRDIERYNKVVMENRQFSLKMPYLLIVIDELSDLMMMSPADVEVSIIRIAQKARACGIHLIIATQRPSVDVITGTIKANIPTRIAFSVSSQVDSRTIIDTAGAERLLGKGDMLYLGNGQSSSVRLQGTFVTDDEIERIIEHVRHEASPNYLFGQEELLKSAIEEEETDPLFEEAVMFIYEQGSASTSLLQRNFSIGYNRAAKLMDRIEKHGFISEQRGSRARDVLLTQADIEQLAEPVI